jgi:hypothetical protein
VRQMIELELCEPYDRHRLLNPELKGFLRSRGLRPVLDHERSRPGGAEFLDRQMQGREQAMQQLKANLGRGAARAECGELLDGGDVLNELGERIEERRRAKACR